MEKGSNKVQYWVTFAVALASMTSSVAFSWTTPVIPKFHNNETALTLTDDTQISWVVVAMTPGLLLGTIITKFQSDKCGRRFTLLESAFPFCIGTVFILFATNAWMLYIGRFLWGIGAGIIQTVVIIYIAEIASKEIRGSLTVGYRFLFNFGSFLVIAIGSFVSFQILSLMLIILPIGYFLACWWVPESPYYLLKEGKVEAAGNALMKLNGYKDEKVLDQKLSEMRIHVREDMRRSTTMKELFMGQRYRRALIISFGLRMFQLLSGSIPIQQYLGRIMQETNSAISVSTGLMIFAAVRLVTSMLASGLVDRLGRRPLLIFSFLAAFLSFTVVGAEFFVHEAYAIDHYSNFSGYVIFVGILCFSIVSTLGYDTLIFVIPAEIFPLNVKALAMTCMNLFGGVITFVSILWYQNIKDWLGLYGVFWFFGTVALFGAVFSYFAVLETKGKSLREIQMELQGPLYEEDSEVEKKTDEAETKLMAITSHEEKESVVSNQKDCNRLR